MKRDKKIDIKPFDRNRVPPRQNLLLLPLIWLVCFVNLIGSRLKINKVGMKGLKPPFIVFGTHHSFVDFCVTPLALFPYRANYVAQLETFEEYGEEFYRQVGCLGTRKYITDNALVKNIKRVIDRKDILVVFPEARYSNVGTSSKLEKSLGKLCKMLNVPVVVINMRGNYLRSPIWNVKIRKEAKLDTVITRIFTVEELKEVSYQEVNKKIQDYMTYDEYKWQFDTKHKITDKKRSEGLELVLYKCPCCEAEFRTETRNEDIYCMNCKSEWKMTEYGKLELVNKTEPYRCTETDFSHIPNWYEWERSQVIKEIEAGKYYLNIKVHIEALPNAVNFIDLGDGNLIHNKKGFTLTFVDFGDTKKKDLHFNAGIMSSVHTEYNYRKKGQCITLSTLDNTYFIYPRDDGFNVTKIQFATEYLYLFTHRR